MERVAGPKKTAFTAYGIDLATGKIMTMDESTGLYEPMEQK